MQKKIPIPKTRDELIEQVFAIWSDIDIQLLEKLSDSIFKRMEEVLKRKGQPINF